MISGRLTAMDDPIKGWIAGFLGLFLAQVGQEGIHAYQRFSYGSVELAGGLGLLPALVGAFGFAEILCVMKQPAYETVRDVGGRVLPRLARGRPTLVDDPALGPHRHQHGHRSRRRRGHGRLGLLRRRAPGERDARPLRSRAAPRA